MKKFILMPFLAATVVIGFSSCKSIEQYGAEQETPFRGSAYESSGRYLRAVGKGQSSDERVARKKSDMDARTQLASMTDVSIREVADEYLKESAHVNASDVISQFQSLTRQVMDTRLADVRKQDEKSYYDGQRYTVFVAYEIHKKSMFDMMEDQIEITAERNETMVQTMKEILAEARKQAEE